MTIGPDDELTVPEEPEAEPELDPVREADDADVVEQHEVVPYDEDEDGPGVEG